MFQKRLSDLSEDSFSLHMCDSLIINFSPLLRDYFFLAEKENRYVRVLALN